MGGLKEWKGVKAGWGEEWVERDYAEEHMEFPWLVLMILPPLLWLGTAGVMAVLFWLGWRRRHRLGGLAVLVGKRNVLPLSDIAETDLEGHREAAHRSIATWELQERGHAEPLRLTHRRPEHSPTAPPPLLPPQAPKFGPAPLEPPRRVRFLKDAVSYAIEPVVPVPAAPVTGSKEAPTEPAPASASSAKTSK